MSKQTYRFGWPYFATKQIRFIKAAPGDNGLVHMKGVIRDTHQTWDVQALYSVFLRSQKVQHVERTQPETPSETQDTAPSSEPDTAGSREAAESPTE